MSGTRLASAVALLWLAVALAYWWSARGSIATLSFPDQDDPMRLQQVRDLLAGQSWFDVSQHRMNWPAGAPMHWSRLVDLPIALVILIATLLVGPAMAETAALVLVPLVTLGCAMALSVALAGRLIGRRWTIAGAAMVPLTVAAIQQMRPLRIDHHGWQAALALALALALVDRRPLRSGLLAGIAAGAWLSISLEGLPIAAGAGAIVALGWLLDPGSERRRFLGFATALATSALLLFAITHDPAGWRAIACDAVSVAHLALIGFAAAGTLLVTAIGTDRPLVQRALLLAVLGGACILLFLGVAPQCVGGAFAELDPLVARFWYDQVPEGLPLWRQSPAIAAGAIGFPLVACLGLIPALRTRDPRWRRYALLLGTAMLATLFVQRSGAVANLLAIPPALMAMRTLLAHTGISASPIVRVIGSALGLLALLPLTPALLATAMTSPKPDAGSTPPCGRPADFARLARLPRGQVLSGTDLGSTILVATPHFVVASGHHRNAAAMRDTIRIFLGSERQTRALIAARRIDYVVACPDMAEMELFAKVAPDGFWARLRSGRGPHWVRPLDGGSSPVRIWRVVQ